MATPDEVMNAMRNADKVGDSNAVRQLGVVLRQMQSAGRMAKMKQDNPAEYDAESPEFKAKYDPTAGMSTTQKVLAGVGKAFTDVGRGAGQLLGINSQKEIDDAKALDAPLMNTGAGQVGNVAGSVAAALPSMFIPGGQGLAGAAAIGGVTGLLQPTATGESRLQNTVLGGVVGGAAPVVARLGVAAYKGGKALTEPLSEAGRQAIAGRTMQRFGVQEADLAGLTSAPTATGARQTLADQIKRPEGAAAAARLQDGLRAADPELAAQFAAREMDNNAARTAVLKDMSGESGQREFFDAARSTAAKELYDKAFTAKMDTGLMSPAQRGEMAKLLKMPAIRDAMRGAQESAANQGANLANRPQGSIEGLHQMKLALDDQIASLSNGSASQVNKAMSIGMARDRLMTFIEKVSPDYGEARATYAAMSKPLNQMDVAAELLKKGTSPTTDLAGNARLMPDALARAARDEGKLIKSATGRDLAGGKLSDLLDPTQLAQMKAVLSETDRAAAVARAGNGPGSATAQRMATNNVLSQFLTPLGVSRDLVESFAISPVAKVPNMLMNFTEPKVQATLMDLLQNPAKAQAAMLAARTTPQKLSPEVRAALPYLAQALKVSAPTLALSGQR